MKSKNINPIFFLNEERCHPCLKSKLKKHLLYDRRVLLPNKLARADRTSCTEPVATAALGRARTHWKGIVAASRAFCAAHWHLPALFEALLYHSFDVLVEELHHVSVKFEVNVVLTVLDPMLQLIWRDTGQRWVLP